MSVLTYRRDIDGLRAIAVIPVMLFHAGASWLPGGFVGVDIFFVISGYLITSIILREIAKGTFTFMAFYERRIRRIIPALTVMVLVTVATFQIIALPSQAQNASESAIAALLSVSNIYFWQSTGYFAPTAEFMPLLHTWSLAVEEQFYLLFPIILLALWQTKLPLFWILTAGTAAAFALGVWLSSESPSFAYYMLPARAWELAIGAIIATQALPQPRGRILQEAVPALGLALVLLSLVYIDSAMMFPGWIALLPCMGAALIIYAGGSSWIARNVLSSRPLVFIGLLSYSLYLWHWPILTAARIRTANIELESWVAATAVAATFLVAFLSWRYVEKPFRESRTMPTPTAFKQIGVCSLAVISIAVGSIAMNGFPGRLNEEVRQSLSASLDTDPFRTMCDGSGSREECRFGSADARISYAIVGDSHAAAIRPAIEASGILEHAAGTLYWAGACPLLDGAELIDGLGTKRCNSFKSKIWEILEKNKNLDTIVLAGRWPYYMTAIRPESGGSFRHWLVDSETITPSEEENRRVLLRSLKRTLDRLTSAGLNVIIIGSVPEPGFDVPQTVAMARFAGITEAGTMDRATVEQRTGLTDTAIQTFVQAWPNVRFVSVWKDAFCDETSCAIKRDGIPLYYDGNHLTASGASTIVGPVIRKKFHLANEQAVSYPLQR